MFDCKNFRSDQHFCSFEFSDFSPTRIFANIDFAKNTKDKSFHNTSEIVSGENCTT